MLVAMLSNFPSPPHVISTRKHVLLRFLYPPFQFSNHLCRRQAASVIQAAHEEPAFMYIYQSARYGPG